MPNPADRSSLLHSFESILRLPSGFLVPEPDRSNRSLTAGEVELLRRINSEWHANQWTSDAYHQLMRNGVIRQMLISPSAGHGEPRISTPHWAIERSRTIGEEAAGRIAATSARVIGDLAHLAEPPASPAEVRADDEPIPLQRPSIDTAVDAVLGAVKRSGAVRIEDDDPILAGRANPSGGEARSSTKRAKGPARLAKRRRRQEALHEASAAELVHEVAARVRRRLRPSRRGARPHSDRKRE